MDDYEQSLCLSPLHLHILHEKLLFNYLFFLHIIIYLLFFHLYIYLDEFRNIFFFLVDSWPAQPAGYSRIAR